MVVGVYKVQHPVKCLLLYTLYIFIYTLHVSVFTSIYKWSRYAVYTPNYSGTVTPKVFKSFDYDIEKRIGTQKNLKSLDIFFFYKYFIISFQSLKRGNRVIMRHYVTLG